MANISVLGKQSSLNLLHKFKRRMLSTQEIQGIFKRNPMQNRYLGHLPKDWFERAKTPSEISSLTQSIFETFSNFVKSTFSYATSSRSSFFKPYHRRKFCKLFNQLTGKKLSIRYFDRGLYSKVFKMKVNDKDYALKVFHKFYIENLAKDVHGNVIEIANEISYNHARNSRKRVRFFFGKIAPNEHTPDGFIVSEFVHKTKKKTSCPQGEPSLFEYRRFDTQDAYYDRNNLNGKIFDFGYILKTFSNKKAEKIAKEMLPLIAKGDVKGVKKLIEQYKGTSGYSEVIENIMQRFQLEEIRPTIVLSPEQMKIKTLLEKSGV